MVMDEAVDLRHIHEARRQLGLRALGDGAVLTNDPGVLFEVPAGGQGVGEAVELVMICRIESYQALEVGTRHDQGGYQIDRLYIKRSRAIILHVWHLELVDVLCQDPPLAQGPP